MNYEKYLKEAGVPADLWPEAVASLKASKVKAKQTLWVKLTAPIVMAWVCARLPWEANKLPEKYWKYDNEISINGDRSPWVDGVRQEAPLEDTPEARELCYYADGHHPRSRWARYVWLGWRNRGSLWAYSLGPVANKGIEYWGDYFTNNGHPGTIVWAMENETGTRDWQVYSIAKLNTPGRGFAIRRNMGVKVSNVFKHGAERAMIVNIPFSLQGWDA